MTRRKKARLSTNQEFRRLLSDDWSNYNRFILTHPDSDHALWLRVPHHGSISALDGLKPSVLYLYACHSSQVDPPRFAQYLLLCFVPRKNREYLLGCLEEEFRTVLLPKYGQFWAGTYYWIQVIQSLAAVGWGLVRKLSSLAAIWRLLH
jgi:hypothetical protein